MSGLVHRDDVPQDKILDCEPPFSTAPLGWHWESTYLCEYDKDLDLWVVQYDLKTDGRGRLNKVIIERHTRQSVERLMCMIAKKNGLELVFLKANQGKGGYNYGGSAGDCIQLAPFKKGKAGDKIGKYVLEQDCDNPLECMFLTFFHELAHCRLSGEIAGHIEGYSTNQTSRFQFELWITMKGIEYAQREYAIVFSDKTVKWMLDETATYIRETAEEGSVVASDVTEEGYVVRENDWWKDVLSKQKGK